MQMEKLDVQIQPKLKKIALYTLIFMALLHGYRYVSLGFSHDSLAFAWQPDLEWQISLGRYMQPLYWWIIRGRIAAPFIVGVLSYGYMVGSVYGVASLLDLKAKTSLFLLAGLMCGSLAFIALDATYSHTADVYMLALMLNIAAAWLCLRGRRRVPSCARGGCAAGDFNGSVSSLFAGFYRVDDGLGAASPAENGRPRHS